MRFFPIRSMILTLILLITVNGAPICAQSPTDVATHKIDDAVLASQFRKTVAPLLKKFCIDCHGADHAESGIRIDVLDDSLPDRHLRLWMGIRKQIAELAMPPEDETQPTPQQREQLLQWIDQALHVARTRPTENHGSVRRLTVSQYRNTLRDLLGLEEDLTDVLPPDAVSKDGFTNNSQAMVLSPLQVEAYFSIAEQALDRCIVDPDSRPAIQTFRVDLGRNINPEPFPEKLILGANNHLLPNADFIVSQPVPSKTFDFHPSQMRTKYRFHEGYQGNATVRGWRDYDSIYHAVFACMRGKKGYPKGNAYETVPGGLLLRPAIPSAELFGTESTYGPHANFKISVRELPTHGNFRITVRAAKYNDGLLLDRGQEAKLKANADAVTVQNPTEPQIAEIVSAGIYQVSVHVDSVEDAPEPKKPRPLLIQLGDREFSGSLQQPAFLVVRLPAGPLKVHVQDGGPTPVTTVALTRLPETANLADRFLTFERRQPRVGVHIGLRRDCGSTLSQVEMPQTVASSQLSDFIFRGDINNFASPDVQKDNDNYLAGIREIGVRSEYTDGRDMPRLLIRSVEFEGPYYETWPPKTHHSIFIESDHNHESEEYARDVIGSFAERAFRRPVTAAELTSLLDVWRDSLTATGDFRQSIRDALVVVLTSPQFLFLIEHSHTPEPEDLSDDELASKLSYFLWNTRPDDRLLSLAAKGQLRESLAAETKRLIEDPRFEQFAAEFTSQWLSLDKLDVVESDRDLYPRLTRETKRELRREPVRYLQHLIRNNLPAHNLVQSDFLLANEVVAAYYDMADRTENGFEFVRLPHDNPSLGGLLTQAGILAGLSDGRESNPVKRGAWLARRIIAEPPADPPPNVPALDEDTTALSLRERLERHRNQKGCVKCHEGIDPWGVPFEQFDAGGRLKNLPVDATSTLPDGTKVSDLQELRHYLASDRIDQVAFSFLKHLASYAVGDTLTYNEVEMLRARGLQLKSRGYRMQDMVRLVVESELFLKK
ncbi:MAG: DUF1592 domain-containing protein [Fuerstiella sp.]